MSNQPKISEAVLRSKWSKLIPKCVEEAADFLDLDLQDANPTQVVRAIDKAIVDFQNRDLEDYELEPEDLEEETYVAMLGSLWGQQIVDALGFEWVELILDGDKSSATIAVVSSDRSIAVTPFLHLRECIDGQRDVTIALSFDMLLSNHRIPKFPPNSYTFVS